MNPSSGTPLYLQVEEALGEFKTGVTKLRAQQAQTDTLLSKGDQALENLVHQISRVDSLKSDVESDLRLMEQFRETIAKEARELQNRIHTDFSEHELQTSEALSNLKTDFSVRRQELLGLIQAVRHSTETVEQSYKDIKAEMVQNLIAQEKAMEGMANELGPKVRSLSAHQSQLSGKIIALEKKSNYLIWAVIGLGIVAVLALII